MEVIWTDYSLDSLKAIFDYIKQNSILSASKLVNEILDFSESLSSFPYKYPICKVFHTSRNPIKIQDLKDI